MNAGWDSKFSKRTASWTPMTSFFRISVSGLLVMVLSRGGWFNFGGSKTVSLTGVVVIGFLDFLFFFAFFLNMMVF